MSQGQSDVLAGLLGASNPGWRGLVDDTGPLYFRKENGHEV